MLSYKVVSKITSVKYMVARFGEKFGRKNSCCVLGQGAGFDDVFIECTCSIYNETYYSSQNVIWLDMS